MNVLKKSCEEHNRKTPFGEHVSYVKLLKIPCNIRNAIIDPPVTYKGALKWYFMNYSSVVIILLNTGLYKSLFSVISFGKQVFHLYEFFCFLSAVSVLNLTPSF